MIEFFNDDGLLYGPYGDNDSPVALFQASEANEEHGDEYFHPSALRRRYDSIVSYNFDSSSSLRYAVRVASPVLPASKLECNP